MFVPLPEVGSLAGALTNLFLNTNPETKHTAAFYGPCLMSETNRISDDNQGCEKQMRSQAALSI